MVGWEDDNLCVCEGLLASGGAVVPAGFVDGIVADGRAVLALSMALSGLSNSEAKLVL
jgi:hypothetical protein